MSFWSLSQVHSLVLGVVLRDRDLAQLDKSGLANVWQLEIEGIIDSLKGSDANVNPSLLSWLYKSLLTVMSF